MRTINTPFPRSKNPHFQNEAKYKTFLVIKSFLGMKIKNHSISVVWYKGLEQLRKGLLWGQPNKHSIVLKLHTNNIEPPPGWLIWESAGLVSVRSRVRTPAGPALRVFKSLRRKCCLCNDSCKQLDFLVFSDKDEKPYVLSHSTYTYLVLVGRKRTHTIVRKE